MTPPAAACIALLKTLLTVRGLRTDHETWLVIYYLRNLDAHEGGLNERQPTQKVGSAGRRYG